MMIEIIVSSIAIFTLIVLMYQYTAEKIDENHKLPFNIKYGIK